LNSKRKIFIVLIIVWPLWAFTQEQKRYINPTGKYVLVSKIIHRNHELFGRMGDIKVIAISRKRIIVKMDINTGAISYNSGEFVDTMFYNSNNCVNRPMKDDRSCKIRFVFSDRGVRVSQQSDDANFGCGFGHAVYADGFYRKLIRIKKHK